MGSANSSVCSETCPTDIPLEGQLRKRGSSVWMRGCGSYDEHRFKKHLLIQILRPLKGGEGLEASGLEYRPVTLLEDGAVAPPKSETNVDGKVNGSRNGIQNGSQNGSRDGNKNEENDTALGKRNPETMMRLFHTESNTMVTASNRKEFIADGDHFDIITRLATEYAQETMIREGLLEWVVIEPELEELENTRSLTEKHPIRALVSRRLVEDESRIDTEPTLLIITGKGRPRAGIFSRYHLLTSGLECSSAVPFVREATKRKMNVIILDPNARGDQNGMDTVRKSMMDLFQRWDDDDGDDESSPTQPNLFVLSHSQSGSQFVRYLLDRPERYLRRIAAIAFTDSSHNLNWTAKNKCLRNMLESDRCLYFKRIEDNFDHAISPRSNQNMDDHILNPLSSLGQVVDTDKFWKHRFGLIKTLSAGTSEHSLTNWFPRNPIWEHFDRYLQRPEDG